MLQSPVVFGLIPELIDILDYYQVGDKEAQMLLCMQLIGHLASDYFRSLDLAHAAISSIVILTLLSVRLVNLISLARFCLILDLNDARWLL